MTITQVRKPLLIVDPIVVFFDDVEFVCDADLKSAALVAANETVGSVFGVWVRRDSLEPTVATVTINKD